MTYYANYMKSYNIWPDYGQIIKLKHINVTENENKDNDYSVKMSNIFDEDDDDTVCKVEFSWRDNYNEEYIIQPLAIFDVKKWFLYFLPTIRDIMRNVANFDSTMDVIDIYLKAVTDLELNTIIRIFGGPQIKCFAVKRSDIIFPNNTKFYHKNNTLYKTGELVDKYDFTIKEDEEGKEESKIKDENNTIVFIRDEDNENPIYYKKSSLIPEEKYFLQHLSLPLDKDNYIGGLFYLLIRNSNPIDLDDWLDTVKKIDSTITKKMLLNVSKEQDKWRLSTFEELNEMANNGIKTLTYVVNTKI